MCMSLFFFSSRRRHTRLVSDWSSDVCSSDLWAIFQNESNVLGLYSTCLKSSGGRLACALSVMVKFSPNKSARTVAAAADCVACPPGKAGKGGSGQNDSHLSLMCLPIKLDGRSEK